MLALGLRFGFMLVSRGPEIILHIDFTLFNAQGETIGRIKDFVARAAPRETIMKSLQYQSDIPRWFYETVWKSQPLPQAIDTTLQGTWLVFADPSKMMESWMSQTHTIHVLPGPEFAQISKDRYQLNPQNKNDFEKLLEAILSDTTLTGIIDLWALEGATEEPTLNLIQKAQEKGTETLLFLIQALLKTNLAASPPIWLITLGIQAVDDHPLFLPQTPLTGLRKTAVLEHPNIVCKHIDLDPTLSTQSQVQLILQEMNSRAIEDQIAYRKGERFVPRLNHIPIARLNTKELIIDPQGSYLISGGFGGLGLKVAHWLISAGAKHLVLAGRKLPQESVIDQLKNGGIQVEPVQADISNEQAVATLMQKFGRSWPELKGIVHAAGMIEDAALLAQEWSSFERVFAPKMRGGWNLHQASLDKPLDFFVLFSSLASVIGSPGQSNYAAANAFLDGLASFRKSKGLPALAICWGPWSEIGMAAQLTGRHQAGGMLSIKPEEGIIALEGALRQNKAQILIAHINWNAMAQKQLKEAPWLENLMPLAGRKAAHGIFLKQLQKALPNKRITLIREHVRQLIRTTLGFQSDDLLSDDQGFFDSGMDSIMAVEVKNILQNDIGPTFSLTDTIAFDYPTINSMSQHLEKLVFESQKKEPEETMKKSEVISEIDSSLR